MAKQSRSLSDYKKKRDFAVTPEPVGGAPKSKAATMFCVQKHLARSLHYDFRLEHNGVLLSWAVPKGPSLDPKDKRFAARTEDHPFDYGDFEGVIPEGYGAGLVMLWDRGTWMCETGDVDAALKKGELKITLDGVKLKGSWVLIRTRPSEAGKEQWLLIKHKDKWAGEIDVVNFAPMSVKSFGDYVDILRAKGIPKSWQKKLPITGGETGAMLREIVATASEVIDQPKRASAKKSKVSLNALALRFGAKKPKLTNLDKPLYPDGFTKGQLIDYYTRIAPLILPHLAGRAVTTVRFPDGVNGKSFFQKRCPDHRPPWVKTVRVANDEGETIDYCKVEDISTLVWLANLAAIELHVPLALAKDPDTPTAMIFDLDPGPGTTARQCIEVAQRIADLFKQMNLVCAAKFSGKKGVHLLVPLNTAGVTFEQTKTFAKAVAQTLARDDPNRITSQMRKDLRDGKVFIDWNQNDRSKTHVCAYSLRATETPQISWPIDLSRPTFTPPDARRVRVEGDALAELLSVEQRLPSRI